MKRLTLCLSASLILSLTSSITKAAEPVEASEISNYVGAYRGSAVVNGTGAGTTRASFTGSRNREVGTLRLTTTSDDGTNTFIEVMAFRDRRVTYSLNTAGAVGTGRGTATISKNVIRYRSPFSIMGSSLVSQGTIRKASRRMSIKSAITGPTTIYLSYSLSKIGN